MALPLRRQRLSSGQAQCSDAKEPVCYYSDPPSELMSPWTAVKKWQVKASIVATCGGLTAMYVCQIADGELLRHYGNWNFQVESGRGCDQVLLSAYLETITAPPAPCSYIFEERFGTEEIGEREVLLQDVAAPLPLLELPRGPIHALSPNPNPNL